MVVFSQGDYYTDVIDPLSGEINTEHFVFDEKRIVKDIDKKLNIGLGLGANTMIPLNEKLGILIDLRGDIDLLKNDFRYRFLSFSLSSGFVYRIK